jgi:hypothetical protein
MGGRQKNVEDKMLWEVVPIGPSQTVENRKKT